MSHRRMIHRSIFLTATAALAVTLFACRTGPPQDAGDLGGRAIDAELPVTKVVLYQSGVGYFERRGRVEGNLLHLRIRPDQVMDVLKSLTVVDRRSGQAVSVSLPVEKSRLMKLSELPPQVRESGGLLAIARAFRGASAIIRSERGTFHGRIVGTENVGTAEKPDWRLTLLAKGAISSHRIAKLRELKVLDRTLTVGLSKSLDAALNKGNWKPVRLTVRLGGKGPHDLSVSYVVPMPAWKPAYRLVVGKDQGDILLQGWSVVDNLSGDHWKRVSLSLTAGTPLAFKYDLYSPRDVSRPDLTPRGVRMAHAPPKMEPSTATTEKPKMAPRRRYYYKKYGRRSRRRGTVSGLYGSGSSSRGGDGDLDDDEAQGAKKEDSAVSSRSLRRSYRALVSGRRVGALFRYDIDHPITVPDRSSSLVSIINKKVRGSDVLYAVDRSGQVNPYRAVRFHNDSGFVMEGGPVTIYREGAFVGEALSARIEKNATAFVPYSIEGRVLVHRTQHQRDEGLKLVRVIHGYVTVQTQRVNSVTYSVTNRTGKGATLYVARRKRSGWKVVVPGGGVVTERSVYYVPIQIKPEGVTTFTIKEQTPVKRRLTMLSSRARQAIGLYLKGEVPPRVRQQLAPVLKLWDQIAEISTKMITRRSSIQMLRQRLAEIRANIKTLGTKFNLDLRRKLLVSLTDIEKRLSKLNREWVELNMRRGEMRQRLRVLFRLIKL